MLRNITVNIDDYIPNSTHSRNDVAIDNTEHAKSCTHNQHVTKMIIYLYSATAYYYAGWLASYWPRVRVGILHLLV